ncbi:hypothetical protein GC169_05150 [bacterium]|nr:hypothetical protein [bacterium]
MRAAATKLARSFGVLPSAVRGGVLSLALTLGAACAPLSGGVEQVTGRSVSLDAPAALRGADLELKAYAAAAWWSALQTEAAEQVLDPSTPPAVKEAIRRVDAAGSPVVLALIGRMQAYSALRAGGADAVEVEAAREGLAGAEAAARASIGALAALVGVSAGAIEGGEHDE